MIINKFDMFIIYIILIIILIILIQSYSSTNYKSKKISYSLENENEKVKIEYDIKPGMWSDFYAKMSFNNDIYNMLLDTGSTPTVIVNYDSKGLEKVKEITTRDIINYLGFAVKPKAFYKDKLNKRLPVTIADVDVIKTPGDFMMPHIMGMADDYSKIPNWNSMNLWEQIDNIVFDFGSRKFILNEENDIDYDYTFKRNLELPKLFNTHFYVMDLYVSPSIEGGGEKVPVIIDTGLGQGIFYGLDSYANSPDSSYLKDENGNLLFRIYPQDKHLLPKESIDDKWRDKKYIIIGNGSLIRPIDDNNKSYKIRFEKEVIKIKLVENKYPKKTTSLLQSTKNNISKDDILKHVISKYNLN